MIQNYDVIDIMGETRNKEERKLLDSYLEGVYNGSYKMYYIEGEDPEMDAFILNIYKREGRTPPECLLLSFDW